MKRISMHIVQLIVAIAVALTGLTFMAPATNASTGSTTTVTATPEVLNATAKFVGKSKKVEACRAFAEKHEQQAPPRDPQALCKGKLKVKIVGMVQTPACPSGWFGGQAKLRISFLEVLKAKAFAKTVASGDADALAETKIVDRVKVTGEAKSTCVLIPVVTPPPPVEHDECPNLPGNQPSGYNCYPTPPPVYDHCPNLPGDQPSGYNCYPTPPPVYDHCPNLPGNQPSGYNCYRPTGEIVQWPAHLAPGEYYRLKFVGSDPEDGGAVDLIYTVAGGASLVKPGDPDYANHPTICDIEGTNKVCTVYVRANASTGVEYEITLQVRDGGGLTSPVYTKTGQVQQMPV